MDKRAPLIILLVMFLLACGGPALIQGATPENGAAPRVGTFPTDMSNPYPFTPTASNTPFPSATQIPSATQTMLPTNTPSLQPETTSWYEVTPTPWPTPTPGLATSRTPSVPESCPQPNGDQIELRYHESINDYEQDLLAGIRSLGISESSGKELETSLSKIEVGPNPGNPDQKAYLDAKILVYDLTGDGQPEMAVSLSQFLPDSARLDMFISIVGCQHGEYRSFYSQITAGQGFYHPVVRDLNADGIPEILIRYGYDPMWPFSDYMILEWDGRTFQDVFEESEFLTQMRMVDFQDPQFKDIDGNGTLEIIAESYLFIRGAGDNCDSGPGRHTYYIFMWIDGEFRYLRTEYSKPVYRFEAAFDGDNYTFFGLYDKAIASYRQAIEDGSLEPASRGHLQAEGYFACLSKVVADWTEPRKVRAYAYYRWMILEASLGDFEEAQRLFNKIQVFFPAKDAGHPYSQMANVFWQDYQTSRDAGSACKQVKAWVPDHKEEILYPINDHGWIEEGPDEQSICPF